MLLFVAVFGGKGCICDNRWLYFVLDLYLKYPGMAHSDVFKISLEIIVSVKELLFTENFVLGDYSLIKCISKARDDTKKLY